MTSQIDQTVDHSSTTEPAQIIPLPPSRLLRLGLEFPFMVAPMVGLSHVAFRELVRSYTPAGLHPLRFTEMLSTRRIPDEKLETTNELRTAPDESFFVPQLLGNEEQYIAPSVKKMSQANPWGFDINMGCPVSHTLKHNWGVRLMGDPAYAAQVVEWTKKNTDRPVSVKLRGSAREDEQLDYLLQFTAALESAGADWITIHPRPRAQQHKGVANWDLVREVARVRKIPVVANGDIQTAHDALRMLTEFSADGAMIARAATARPWIMWQIAELMGNRSTPIGRDHSRCPWTPEEEGKEYIRACLKLLDLMQQFFPKEDYILEKFRFFAATGSRWYQFGHSFWKMTTKAKSCLELRDSIEDFGARFENPSYPRVKFL
ncbi:MAG: hypothetical protein RI932_1191 [Pseudomonadota bacterium]|jgi:tRNA-dihydrouridine synthase B